MIRRVGETLAAESMTIVASLQGWRARKVHSVDFKESPRKWW